MQRFFVNTPLRINLDISDRDMIHQILNVLRMKSGDEVILFDGDGSETVYSIENLSKTSIHLRGKGRSFPDTETKREITLYQALPNKYEKIEYILEKGIEIGIRRFIFFRSDRSQKLIISDVKKKRFQLIAKEALEQCGGVIYPEIIFLEKYDSIYIRGESYVMDTHKSDIRNVGMKSKQATLFVGPEGGWSEREIEEMSTNGFIFVHLGMRILRTETAGIVGGFALIKEIM